MNYTKTGTIVSVTPIETLQTGAVKLSYRIDTGDQYNSIWEFEIYKGAEHAEHAHNFEKFNNVGDTVEVEFQIRPREWEGKIYTSLSHWKCTKVGASPEHPNGITEDDPIGF